MENFKNIKFPTITLNLDSVKFALSLLVMALVGAFMFVPPVTSMVGAIVGIEFSRVYMNGMIMGFGLATALWILVDDRISTYVHRQRNLKWAILVLALWMIFGEFLLPTLPFITAWQWAALGIGIVCWIIWNAWQNHDQEQKVPKA